MLSRRVSVRAPLDQPIFAHALVCLGTALSLWWALQFCNLWLPDEPMIARAAAALTWEGARLYLTPLAVLLLMGAIEGGRVASAIALLPLVAVLTAGSVAASVAALDRAEVHDQERIRVQSPVYQDAVARLRVLDAQLERSLRAQEGYDGKEMWSKASALNPEIAATSAQRSRVAASLAMMRTGTLSPNAVAADAVAPPDASASPSADAPAAIQVAPLHPPAPQAPRSPLHLVIILAFKLIAPAVRIAMRMQRRCVAGSQAQLVQTRPAVAGAAPRAPRSAGQGDGYATSYKQVREAVLEGTVPCSTRAIQRAARVGQARALQIQSDLLAEGVIVRSGQGYVLAGRELAA